MVRKGLTLAISLIFVLSLFGISYAASNEGKASQSVEVRTIMEGTEEATDVYIIRSINPGPTVMVVGGTHGDESSGYLAAETVKDWEIDQGTLVVLPRANIVATRRLQRSGLTGDLNRQFPPYQTPPTELARSIWSVIKEYNPSALIDLHESFGIRGIDSGAVGQRLVTHYAKDAREFGLHVMEYMNKYVIPASTISESLQRSYFFDFLSMSKPMIAYKTGSELEVPAFIVEITRKGTSQALRVEWQLQFVAEFLKWFGVVNATTVLPIQDFVTQALEVELLSPKPMSEVTGQIQLQMGVRVPDDHSLAGVSVQFNGTELYAGTKVPEPLTIDTRVLRDDDYDVVLTAQTAKGTKKEYRTVIRVRNWWELLDPLEPPMNSGWFGNIERSLTSETSPGWIYAMDNPEDFFGDEDRKLRTGDTREYLIWETPRLDSFLIKLYARQKTVETAVELAVSADGQSWKVVEYSQKSQASNSSGWVEVTLSGDGLLGTGAKWFKLTFFGSDHSCDDLQLGLVELRGKKE